MLKPGAWALYHSSVAISSINYSSHQEPTGYPAPIRFGRIYFRFCPSLAAGSDAGSISNQQRLRYLFRFQFQTIFAFLAWVRNKGWRSKYRSRAFTRHSVTRNVMFNLPTRKLVPRAFHNAELYHMICSLYRIVSRDLFTMQNSARWSVHNTERTGPGLTPVVLPMYGFIALLFNIFRRSFNRHPFNRHLFMIIRSSVYSTGIYYTAMC